MAFGQDFLSAFFGNDYLRDYTHASKTFRTNGYENSPRFKFLFHVYFTLNTEAIPLLRNIYGNNESAVIGLLVKNIELPKFNLDTHVMNQYNRKRIVQTKINYEPVNVVFHDDGGDMIRTLWYNYYAYYYKDPNQPYRGEPVQNGSMGVNANRTQGFNYNNRDIYDNDRFVNDWGYAGEAYSDGTNSAQGKPAFFKDISIYGLNQHKFVEYVLVNPMIQSWQHDTYDYSQGDGVMENRMTIQYETVKYYTGAIGAVRPDTNVQGFADPAHYDVDPSPLRRPGGTQSFLGQGGLLDAGLGIYQDLQSGSVAGIIGAVQKAGTAYNTFKGKDLKAIANEEARLAVKDVLKSSVPGAVRPQPGTVTGIVSSTVQATQQALKAPLFPTPPRGSR